MVVEQQRQAVLTLCLQEQAYRFFSYIFVHAGWGHLVFNLLIQLLIGIPLEMVHGSVRVGTLYLCGALAGSFASTVLDPTTNVVGASGADYALIGAHVANVIANFNEVLCYVGVLCV